MSSNFQKICDFHARFDPDAGELAVLLPRRVAFLKEEMNEVEAAVNDVLMAQPEVAAKAKAALAKELVDVLYLAYGSLHLLGVDGDAAFAEVHASNMSKTPDLVNKKAIKGADYKPADMMKLMGADHAG